MIDLQKEILEKISQLSRARLQVKERATAKAKAIADYERELAITILRLKANDPIEFEGKTVTDTPTTIMEKVARGICFEAKLKAVEAEGMYKSIISNMEAIKAELNGLQSINRHLSEV